MQNVKKKGIVEFLKKYGYFIILIACVTALAIILTLASIEENSTTVEVSNNAITFASPILNGNVIKNYSNTELQYNKTLNQWEAHFGVDIEAMQGENVIACYDGIVSEVYSNTLDGTVVKINHGNGLVSVYGSLDSDIKVTEGTKVTKGDIIGSASNSAGSEALDGSHIHFEVWKDGSQVDPNAYLSLSTK